MYKLIYGIVPPLTSPFHPDGILNEGALSASG